MPQLPGAKSVTNRVLLMAALGTGTVRIKNILEADDTKVMLNGLLALDACEIVEHTFDSIVIKGHGGKLTQPQHPIYVANSGTTARFLTTVLLLLDGRAVISGNDRMKERPIVDLLEALSF